MGSAEPEVLLRVADEAMEKALASFSGFRVGAALLASNGEIYTGCNIENPSLMLTTCAERVALLKALSEGAREFRAIAVVSSGINPCFPCGSCRQMLMEFAPDLDVYLRDGAGVQKYTIKDLLPYPFEPDTGS